MGSAYEGKIKEGARPWLEEGEEVLASLVARPRGWTQAAAGSRALGSRQQASSQAAGEEAGLTLASPMALAITQRRLLSLSIGSPVGLGIGGKVKELVGSVPLSDVDSITVKRLAVGKVVSITVRGGEPIKLETNALGDAKGVVAAFEQARTPVGA